MGVGHIKAGPTLACAVDLVLDISSLSTNHHQAACNSGTAQRTRPCTFHSFLRLPRARLILSPKKKPSTRPNRKFSQYHGVPYLGCVLLGREWIIVMRQRELFASLGLQNSNAVTQDSV